ncbi:hypothetical protein TVAG_370090 [Trichomonas vaginalis G3]|uniref:Uncharacterized protein n=1 Tax=Trichomonas vaginalis (strain ATCC PRA-98 / G3) TaxID=412133 RepID=A2EX61_TRIV3|nr:hypothetical protein TVAGG3_0860200 [Trichomonas vaginalis G3]EAY02781.1 hypothetical protein TVAG_370090 [Trichomonas vaginalis G3]KAI5500615.1 hypothetical protein TVAGG3_0860200 [Trichomonas vaginalis G3]|eukprot:XP_001315004.1 hypothetical protein [Trichomonas vaginalis G3]
MDLSIFKSNVIFIFEFCKLTDDQQDFSVRHCLDLALSPVVEDSEIKDANCQTVYTRLSIFMSFVDFMYSSYNRTPKITKRPPYKDIKCNDPRVRKILDYASSIQYF